MGAKPATVSGLSGLGDIMLTCYGSLSRNRCATWSPIINYPASIMRMAQRKRCISLSSAMCPASIIPRHRHSMPKHANWLYCVGAMCCDWG